MFLTWYFFYKKNKLYHLIKLQFANMLHSLFKHLFFVKKVINKMALFDKHLSFCFDFCILQINVFSLAASLYTFKPIYFWSFYFILICSIYTALTKLCFQQK